MIHHIVHFKYAPSTSPSLRAEVVSRMTALQTLCVDPTTQKPYIVSLVGGTNISKEGYDRGYTHSFVVVFANEKDLEFYVEEDAQHDAFKKFVGPLLDADDGGRWFDFEEGKY